MKLDHWPLLLDRAIAENFRRPFAWGRHDCCLFAANVVRDITGVDFAKNYRERYTDARGGLAILAAVGGVEAIATQALGAPIIKEQAQRGDVVLIDTEGHHALAICTGQAAAAPALDGLVFVPMAQWIKAWRV